MPSSACFIVLVVMFEHEVHLRLVCFPVACGYVVIPAPFYQKDIFFFNLTRQLCFCFKCHLVFDTLPLKVLEKSILSVVQRNTCVKWSNPDRQFSLPINASVCFWTLVSRHCTTGLVLMLGTDLYAECGFTRLGYEFSRKGVTVGFSTHSPVPE